MVATFLECVSAGDAALHDLPAIELPSVNCLRSLPVEELAALNQQVQNTTYPGPGAGYGVFYFGPVVDGYFIQELPTEAFRWGRFYDVPLMVDHSA